MNDISSRTPEGHPGHCPVCEAEISVEPSDPLADAPCPKCGTLIWPISNYLGTAPFLGSRFSPGQRAALLKLAETIKSGDSLDVVETVMELEEAFGVTIPDEDAERMKTIQDFLDWLEERER